MVDQMGVDQMGVDQVAINLLSDLLCSSFLDVSGRDGGQLAAAVVLVVDIVGDVLEVLHVGPDQHVPQGDKVTVLQVLN